MQGRVSIDHMPSLLSHWASRGRPGCRAGAEGERALSAQPLGLVWQTCFGETGKGRGVRMTRE
eukprot:1154177-Pelagomonas_calceolata.AAC.4